MVLPKPCETPSRPGTKTVGLRSGTGRICQVAAFFLRWTCERLLTSSEKKTTRPRRGKARSHGGWNGALSWLFLDKSRTLFYGSGNLWFTVCLCLIESSNKQAVVRSKVDGHPFSSFHKPSSIWGESLTTKTGKFRLPCKWLNVLRHFIRSVDCSHHAGQCYAAGGGDQSLASRFGDPEVNCWLQSLKSDA